MPDLHRALSEISAIRGQIARGTVFRGYGPAALASTGFLAALAALAQSHWLANPAHDIGAYVALWSTTAAIAIVIVGSEAVRRSRRIHDGLADEMLRAAAEQFLPAAVAGILVTIVVVQTAEAESWMLPGLWQILFSLGVFASCHSLPRPMMAIAIWYLATGLACLAFAKDSHALSPWAMGAPFLVGQLLASFLLKRSSRNGDDEV
jgi:hypothetical protein